MTARDFAYWLQGFFEISNAALPKGQELALTPAQTSMVQAHLALVFKHEIDPSMGGPAHQTELNAIHGKMTPLTHIDTVEGTNPAAKPNQFFGGVGPDGKIMRC